MTTAQALKLLETKSLRNMSVKELKEIGKPIISTAKKRVRLIEKKDMLYSPAYQGYIVMKGMKGSLAGTNVNKLRHEIYEAVQFLNAKTSTIKGIRESDKLMEEIMGKRSNDMEFRNLVWSALEIIRNEQPHVLQNYNYREVVERISEAAYEIPTENPRELIDSTMDKLGYANYDGVWVTKEKYYRDKNDWDDIW